MSSSLVSSSLFVLSVAATMFVTSWRRPVQLATRPFVKKLSATASASSAAGGKTSDSAGCVGDSSSCDACSDKINDMLGSVKAYDRHVILCVPSTSVWERDIERQPEFPLTLAKAIEDVKKAAKSLSEGEVASQSPAPKPLKLKLTAMIDDKLLYNHQHARVLVYPDNLLFNVPVEQFQSFANLVHLPKPLNSAPEAQSFQHEHPAWSKLVLVCVHNARDKRCGQAGPEIISELERLLADKQSQGGAEASRAMSIAVRGSSHIGGHVYAGTLIAYPEGQWYGRINKNYAAELLQHIMADSVYKPCERGATSSKVLQW